MNAEALALAYERILTILVETAERRAATGLHGGFVALDAVAGEKFQTAIESEREEDLAVSVLATVISHKPAQNQIVVDAGDFRRQLAHPLFGLLHRMSQRRRRGAALLRCV